MIYLKNRISHLNRLNRPIDPLDAEMIAVKIRKLKILNLQLNLPSQQITERFELEKKIRIFE